MSVCSSLFIEGADVRFANEVQHVMNIAVAISVEKETSFVPVAFLGVVYLKV